MNSADLRTKLIEEIKHIPDTELAGLYDLIQTFRLASTRSATSDLMSFAGCWQDLPEDSYQELIDEISDRRQTAFSERRNRESSILEDWSQPN